MKSVFPAMSGAFDMTAWGPAQLLFPVSGRIHLSTIDSSLNFSISPPSQDGACFLQRLDERERERRLKGKGNKGVKKRWFATNADTEQWFHFRNPCLLLVSSVHAKVHQGHRKRKGCTSVDHCC